MWLGMKIHQRGEAFVNVYFIFAFIIRVLAVQIGYRALSLRWLSVILKIKQAALPITSFTEVAHQVMFISINKILLSFSAA